MKSYMRFGIEYPDFSKPHLSYTREQLEEAERERIKKEIQAEHIKKLSKGYKGIDSGLKRINKTKWQEFKKLVKQSALLLLIGTAIGGAIDLADKTSSDGNDNEEKKTEGRIIPEKSHQADFDDSGSISLPNKPDKQISAELEKIRNEIRNESSEKAMPKKENLNNKKEQAEKIKNTEKQKTEIDVFDPIPYEQAGKIKMDKNFQDKLSKAWSDYYRYNPIENKDFIKGFNRVSKWDPEIKEIFRKNGLPEELRFLTLAESGGDPEAKSKAGAKGPYQLMEKTAKDYGIVVDKKIDMRKDPKKSSLAAVQILKENFNQFKDRRLVFNAWNGGYLRREYLLMAEAKNKPVTFEGFCQFMLDKIAAKKREIDARRLKVSAKTGETVSKIASIYHIDKKKIIEINKLKSEKLSKGQIVLLPYPEEAKKQAYKKEIAGFIQNISFPFKAESAIAYGSELEMEAQNKSVINKKMALAKSDRKNL